MGISVGLVGLGQFGRHFVALYKNHPDVTRLALCDISEQRLAAMARQYRISECYRSLDDICRSDLDALVIITIADVPSAFSSARMKLPEWQLSLMTSRVPATD